MKVAILPVFLDCFKRGPLHQAPEALQLSSKLDSRRKSNKQKKGESSPSVDNGSRCRRTDGFKTLRWAERVPWTNIHQQG